MSDGGKPAGKVYLVGAGPGDEGLLTLRAKECIEAADVIVYDRLVNERILSYARRDAERIYVGKSPDRHTLKQEEINDVLSAKAAEGKTVARLKGGDPFLFGRGGEEALHLAERGIPFEVLPGVTSAISAPAYAGIPVTQRGITSTLAIVTGHEDPTKEESDIDWERISGAGTMVFLMGVKNLPLIAEKLTACGKPPTTPAALIRNGTTTIQQTLTGTLADIAEKAERAGFAAPAVIVVGEVVSLRERINWFETLPLFGRRIVITRSRTQASELARSLRVLGAEVAEFPTIRIEPPSDPGPLRKAARELSDYDWIVFTSVNGVDSFFKELHAQGLDSREFKGVSVCAIGPATASGLARFGINADLIPERFVAESVLEAFDGTAGVSGKRLLLPRADIARELLVEELERRGARVAEVTAYRTVLDERSRDLVPDLFESGYADMITFSSSSTVTNFCKLVGPDRLRQIKGMSYLASIGPITSETLRGHGLEVDVEAETYTIPGLVRAIAAFFAGVPGRKARKGDAG